MKFSRSLGRWALGLALFLLLALISALSVTAQGANLSIPSADLRLWPEYDDPGLLVIFSGEFTTTAAFPQKVAFPVMTGARNIQATVNDPTNGLLNQSWQMEGNKLTYTLPGAGFQVEYYLDRPPSGDTREIKYTFEAPYPIGALEIAVQQPARSTNFQITPAADSTYVGTDGLTYYVINRAVLAAGDKLDITFSYTKTDSGFSEPQLAVPNVTPVAQPTTPSQPATNWLPWALIGVGLVALFGIGIYWFTQQRQPAAPTRPVKKVPARAAVQSAVRATVAGPAVFCTQCGHQLQPEDRFCAQCGAPRKG